MAATITRTQVRQEMLNRVPLLGRVLVADSIQANAIVHRAEYERQRAGLTSFEGQYIHRYQLADPQRWRLISTLNSPTTDGIANVDGPPYVDQTLLPYERTTVHPDDMNFAIAEGQRRQKVLTNIALVAPNTHDMDMEFAGAHYWGDPVPLGGSASVSTNVSKITTDVRSGTQALQCTGTASPSGIWGEAIRVTPGRLVYAAAILRAPILAGSLTFGMRDPSNGANLAGVTISGIGSGGWVLAQVSTVLPSNTNQVNVFFTQSTAGDSYIVDTCFGPYQAGQTEYTLQSAFNEAYKLRFVRPSRFIYPLSTFGFFDADSIEFDGDLTSPEDFNVETFRRDVNANRLRFVANSYNNRNVGWGWGSGAGSAGSFMSSNMKPIWLAMEAQVSDFEPLLTETSVTSQPLDECACFSLRSLFETLASREPQNPAWPPLLAEYAAWAAAELVARPPQPLLRPVRMHLQRV